MVRLAGAWLCWKRLSVPTLTAAERAGKMAGAPVPPAPVALEKIRADLAFSMLL